MTTFEPPDCINCLHWVSDWRCTVFPEGIPDKIKYGEIDHRTPYPGDNGIIFTPIE